MTTTVAMSDVVAALEQLGANLDYDEVGRVSRIVMVGQHIGDLECKPLGFLGDSLRRLNLIYTNIKGPGLGYCRNMRFLERLDLGANVDLGDAAMNFLKPMASLEMLRLWDTKVSDAGLESLVELKRLRWLYLSGTAISDSGGAVLKKMTFLRGLDLRATRVTDRMMRQLASLENLEWLDMSDTRVDGSGLAYLTGLKRLARVHLRHTRIEMKFVEKFHKLHPNCEIDMADQPPE